MLKKVKKLKTSKPSKPNLTEIQNNIIELRELQDKIKLLGNRELELKAILKTYLENNVSPTEKGHRLITVLGKDGLPLTFQATRRRKISMNNDRVVEYFKKKKWDKYVEKKVIVSPQVTEEQLVDVLEKYSPDFLDSVLTVPEDVIQQLIMDEKLDMDEFETLCDISDNYALGFAKEIKGGD